MTGWDELDRFLQTFPPTWGWMRPEPSSHLRRPRPRRRDRPEAAYRYPGVAAHLLACGAAPGLRGPAPPGPGG